MVLKSIPGVQIHMVAPTDANALDTIFGGRVIELASEAAAICARHFAKKPVVAASLERIDFMHPVFVGEELHVTPTLVCAHKTSMQIAVDVKAVNPFTGETRPTNKTLMTFVAIDPKTGAPSPVPEHPIKKHPDLKTCQKLYQQRKKGKNLDQVAPDDKPQFFGTLPGKTVAESILENHYLVMPGDYNEMGLLLVGRYLSWVDIIASLSATRHCRKPVVTASIEGVSFKQRVPKGSVVRLISRVVFAAKSSMQVVVTGWLWGDAGISNDPAANPPDKKIGDSHLTFVALEKTGKGFKTAKVPRLMISGKAETAAYLSGQKRYFQNKKRP